MATVEAATITRDIYPALVAKNLRPDLGFASSSRPTQDGQE
jgi:hypothetical protein